MSWQAVSYAVDVLDQADDLTTADRVVLLLLAEHANRDGTNARPSSSTIANRAGLLPSTVRRCLGRLVSAGIVAADHRAGRPTVYRFPLSTPVAPVRQVVDITCSTSATGVLHQRDRGVAPARHEPVRNRSENQRGRIGAQVCPRCDGTGWEYVDDRHVARCADGCVA